MSAVSSNDQQSNQPAVANIEAVYEFTGQIGEQEMKDFLDFYIRSQAERLVAFRQALAELNIEEIYSISHAIKSNSLYVGAKQLSKACQTLEDQTKEDASDIERITELGKESVRQITEVLKFLTARRKEYGD